MKWNQLQPGDILMYTGMMPSDDYSMIIVIEICPSAKQFTVLSRSLSLNGLFRSYNEEMEHWIVIRNGSPVNEVA